MIHKKMPRKKVKELIVCYIDGTIDQFLNVEFTLKEGKEIVLTDNRNRYVYIQLNSILKYVVEE